jgi:hypothetical protein
MKWDVTFEGQPSGSNFGSVSEKSFRDMKIESINRFDLEHIRTESATPTAIHKLGQTRVVEEQEDDPISNGVVGALIEHSHGLYYDLGYGLWLASSGNHLNLEVTDIDIHDKYVKIAGGEISGTVFLSKIIGLPVTDPVDNEVLSIGQHNSVKHSVADVVASTLFNSRAIFKEITYTVNGSYSYGVSLGMSDYVVPCFYGTNFGSFYVSDLITYIGTNDLHGIAEHGSDVTQYLVPVWQE